MQVRIEKKALLNLIGKTQNIVEKRNTMPILVNVLLEAEENKFRVFATDLEVSLTDEVECEVIKPGKVAIGVKSLFDIAKELDDAPIELEKRENNWLEIKQAAYTSKLVGISADEYPVFPAYKSENYFVINAEVLKEMIDKTLYSVSTDETRYHLNGVYLQHYEDQNKHYHRMVATDGHRLSVIDRPAQTDSVEINDAGVIIPRKGLSEIKKLVEGQEGDFKLALEGSQLIVQKESTILMIRLIEGKYPNYKQLIPAKLNHQILINKEAFLTALKRVLPLANQKSKGVTLTLTNGKMEITSNNPELGDARAELEIDYSGNEMKIGFNAKYITDVLNTVNNDIVELQLNDQLSPGMIRPHKDLSYTCVVMPMRI